MESTVNLYTNDKNEILKFVEKTGLDTQNVNENTLEWSKKYLNPIEIANIVRNIH